MSQEETIVEPKFHYWFLTAKVTGPLPHEIKEIPINLQTQQAIVTRADYNNCLNYALNKRAEEMKCEATALYGVLTGPCYAGHMTQATFEGEHLNEPNGEKQGQAS